MLRSGQGDRQSREALGFERQILLTEAKRNKRASETLGILTSQAEEQIDVPREPWVTMVCNGLAADNHVLNPVLFD